MKTVFSLLVVVAGLFSTAFSGDSFVPIFNGRNLDGWDAKEGCWEVRDGEVWCTGEAQSKNWLIYRGSQPANFVLRLEFRWDKGNSGVQVRSDDLGDWMVFGYQVEVAEQEKMGLWHHSLLDRDHPKKEVRHLMATAGQSVVIDENGEKETIQNADPATIQAHFRNHEWNSMEIIVEGSQLIQKINGVVFSVLDDRDPEMSRKRGWIALQDHGRGCTVAFRKIELKMLP